MAKDRALRQTARRNALRVAEGFEKRVQYQKAVSLIESLKVASR
jgi:hypothetical protein